MGVELLIIDDDPATRFLFNAIAHSQGLDVRDFEHGEGLAYIKEVERPPYIIVDLKDVPGASLIKGGYESCFLSAQRIHDYLRSQVEFNQREARNYRKLAEEGKIPRKKFVNLIPGFKFMTAGISDSDIDFVDGVYYPEDEILLKVHGSDRHGRNNLSVTEYIVQAARNLGHIDRRLMKKK